jgi:hypothetical protein
MSDRVTEQMRTLRLMAKAGYHIFPLRKSTKLPLLKNWQTTKHSAASIQEYVSKGNNTGVNLRPGQLVIDIDPRNGGMDSMWLLARMTDLPQCPEVLSGRGDGGRHLYLHYSKEAYPHLRTHIPDLPGIDFKSNGLVVAPGSIHQVTGKPYRLVDPSGTFRVPEAPKDLLDLIKAAPPKLAHSRSGRVPPEALKYLLSALDPRDYGAGRHDEWFDLMCSCHDATAGAGIEEFLEWCAGDPMYADEANINMTRNRWHSLTDKDMRKTYLTLFRAVIDSGNRPLLLQIEKDYDFDEKPDDPAHDFDGMPVGDDDV